MCTRRESASLMCQLLIAAALVMAAILARTGSTHAQPAEPLVVRPPETIIDQEGEEDLCLTPPEPAQAPIGTLGYFMPIADAEVQQGNPLVNLGIGVWVGAGYDDNEPDPPSGLSAPGISRALLQYAIAAQLPPGTEVHRATLRSLLGGYCDVRTSTFPVMAVAGPWYEMGVTWASQPAVGAKYAGLAVPVGEGTTLRRYDADVTKLVGDWIEGSVPELGLTIREPAQRAQAKCQHRTFASRANTFYCSPFIELDYTLPPPRLAISPTNLVFVRDCGSGETPSPPQVVRISSTDLAPGKWSATVLGDSDWVHLHREAGTVAHGLADELIVTVMEPASCRPEQSVTIGLQLEDSTAQGRLVQVTLRESSVRVYLPNAVRSAPVGAASASQSAALASQAPPEPRRIVIAIGISDYEDDEIPSTRALVRSGAFGEGDPPMASSDGATVAQALSASGAYDTIALAESRANADLVEACFGQATDRLADAAAMSAPAGSVAAAEPETELVVFFAGHGGQWRDEPPQDESGAGGDRLDEFVALFDTKVLKNALDEPTELVHALLDDELDRLVTESGATRVALVLNSCHAGGMEIRHPRRAVLSASAEDQSSLEDSRLEHGLFTYYVLRAMWDSTSDTNGDGWLSVNELYGYVRAPVASYSRDMIDNWGDETPRPDQRQQDVGLDLTEDMKLLRVIPIPPGG